MFAVATAAALVGVLAAAVSAGASRTTTAPGQPYRIDVGLTDGSIKIERDRFTAADGTTRWPRGALIDFVIKNEGKQAHALALYSRASTISGTRR